MPERCAECGGTSGHRVPIVHQRSCSRAFGKQNRVTWPVKIDLTSVTGTTRPIESLRSQSDRESALRRAIAGACPRIPFGMISAVASQCVGLDLELEAKGESR